MGYRSDVAIALTHSEAILLKELSDSDEELKELLDMACITEHWPPEGEGYITKFKWEYQKWYESFPDVFAMTRFMNNIDGENYRFLRIGEESDDIEEEGYLDCEGMYISRYIEL